MSIHVSFDTLVKVATEIQPKVGFNNVPINTPYKPTVLSKPPKPDKIISALSKNYKQANATGDPSLWEKLKNVAGTTWKAWMDRTPSFNEIAGLKGNIENYARENIFNPGSPTYNNLKANGLISAPTPTPNPVTAVSNLANK